MHRFGIIRCDNSWPVLASNTDMRSYGDRMGDLMDAWGWYEIYMSDEDIDDDDFDANAIFAKNALEPDELLMFAKQVQRAFARGMKPRRSCKIIAKPVDRVPAHFAPPIAPLAAMPDVTDDMADDMMDDVLSCALGLN